MSIMSKVNAALKPLVGLDTDGRPACYPNTLPQLPKYPAIVYQFISNPPAAALTQLARFTDFHVQVTLHSLTYDDNTTGILALRKAALSAIEAMPEYITRENDIEGIYEFEPKAFNWILQFHLRDAES